MNAKRYVAAVAALVLLCAGCTSNPPEHTSSKENTVSVVSGQSASSEQSKTSPVNQTGGTKANESSFPYTQGPLKLSFYGAGTGGYELVQTRNSIPSIEPLPTVDSLCAKSDQIVYGTVTEVTNYDALGTGSSLYQFRVETSYKGDLKAGQTISVVTVGGYIRVSKLMELENASYSHLSQSQQKNGVYLDTLYGAPLPQKGDACMLFLCYPQRSSESPWPKDAYQQTGAFQGRFLLRADGTLTRYVPKDEPTFYPEGNADITFTRFALEQAIVNCKEP